jgi:hypothetical protein
MRKTRKTPGEYTRVSTPTDGKGAAKSTVSGPRRGPAGNGGDSAVRKMQGTEALAKAFPHNTNKPSEIGEAAPSLA